MPLTRRDFGGGGLRWRDLKKLGRVLEGGVRKLGRARHRYGTRGARSWMVYEGWMTMAFTASAATSTDAGRSWQKESPVSIVNDDDDDDDDDDDSSVTASPPGYIFGGRDDNDMAWDAGNVGTPYLVKRPRDKSGDGTQQDKELGWYLYYVGTRPDPATGKTSYAIGCAEQCNPGGVHGLAGPWRRVKGAC